MLFGVYAETRSLQKDGSRSSHCSGNVPSSIIVNPLSSSGDSSSSNRSAVVQSTIVHIVTKDVVFLVGLVVDLLGYRVVGGYVASKLWIGGNKSRIDAPAVQIVEALDQVIRELEELPVVLDEGGGKVRVPHEARAGVEEFEERVVVVVRPFEDEAFAYTRPECT